MTKGKILVTGGCGYIGSHTIIDLMEAGYDVISIDNFVNSSPDAPEGIEKITGKKIINIDVDLQHAEQTIESVKEHVPIAGIIHFAALKSVEESVFYPNKYFQNNIDSTITVLRLMEALDIPYLIFSSSCTVYGSPEKLPVTEDTPLGTAENPYGATKQMCEIMCEQYFRSKEKMSEFKAQDQAAIPKCISLRYFNPAGAHPSALLGESPKNAASNLVPVITETAIGKRKEMIVYGNDYPTRDGSCIRDYVHVTDLAHAHTLALEQLMHQKQTKAYEIYNLGIGEGVTVLEAIEAFENTTGVTLNYRIGPRRPGDVPAIFADNSLIRTELKWAPQHDIRSIMHSAWEWEKARTKNK